jgi:hypothetical protein
MRHALAFALIATLAVSAAWTAGAGAAGRDAIAAIEFHHATLDHYFLTADDAEIARLDSGDLPGWSRTGQSFWVVPPDGLRNPLPPYDTYLGDPVCRFYGLPEYGLDSHFFTGSAAECRAVQERWPGRWILESDNVFRFIAAFDCGDRPYDRVLYRVYNDRPGANHRYVVDPALRDAMVARGWVSEGAVGCVMQ